MAKENVLNNLKRLPGSIRRHARTAIGQMATIASVRPYVTMNGSKASMTPYARSAMIVEGRSEYVSSRSLTAK